MQTEFPFIGQCKEDNQDKVWGYFLRPTPEAEGLSWIDKANGWNCVIFWSCRGGELQFIAGTTGHALQTLSYQKMYNKQYTPITSTQLIQLWPTFMEECSKKLMWAVLAGEVK